MGAEQLTIAGILLAGISVLGGYHMRASEKVYADLRSDLKAKSEELARKDEIIADSLRIVEKHADALPLLVEAIDKLRSALHPPKPESTRQ